MRKLMVTMAAMIAAGMATAGEFNANGCFAKWTDDTLTVGNGQFERVYKANGDNLQTVSFASAGAEWIDAARVAKSAGKLAVTAVAANRSITGEAGLKLEIKSGRKTRTAWLFPTMAGVLMEDPTIVDVSKWKPTGRAYSDEYSKGFAYRAGADVLRLKPLHVEIGSLELVDQTDIRNELVHVRKYLLMSMEAYPIIAGNVFWIEDTLTGNGIAFLRLAPLPADRIRDLPDFVFGGREQWRQNNKPWAASIANGYPMAEVAYRGGKYGRIAAWYSIQRSLRKYVSGRDGMFLTNTWGDGNRDSRISEEFMMKEIVAGGELGVDVIQIDDGWQSGKSANSAFVKNEKGAWSNFRAANPNFWKLDEKKFPSGIDKLVDAAKERGMGFGLWFGPDKTDDNASWEMDADTLIDFYQKHGIRYFKVDGIETENDKGYVNQLKMFSKMLNVSKGDMTFDLDVTGCQKRPGYFGLPDTGPLFLENRYIGGGRYWPHFTLRNVWMLSEVVDPVRLRVEFGNPFHGMDMFGEDPLAPKFWRGDALFATVMMCSPLGWFEISELSPQTVNEMKPLIASWKRERANVHGGLTLPVASAPDGVAWTGFVTKGADGQSAYALIFRELNPESSFKLKLSKILPGEKFSKVELIGGRGKVELDDGHKLKIEKVAKLDFVWVKLTK